MSGHWFMNRAPVIDLPLNGGPVACPGGNIATGCVGGFRPASGGIPGSGIVSAMGVGPAAFTIAPGAFGQAKGTQVVPVPIVASIVQLATAFTFSGPPSAMQATAAAPTFLAAQPALFQANAHANDPGQTAGATPRAAANFAWCPGVGGPACPSGLAATGSTGIQGIVSYTAGANVFGGTMGMLLKGTGRISIVAWTVSLPTSGFGFTPVQGIANIPMPGGAGFMNPQAVGVSYAYANSAVFSSAAVYLGFMTSSMGLVTSFGPVINTSTIPGGIIPGSTIKSWGFPWTTGTVSAMNTESTMGMMRTGTLTAMGTDQRTAAGKGTIVMVAGGTAHRIASTADFETIDVVVLNFSDGTPTPGLGPASLVVLAILMTLGAGYAMRGRYARS